MSLAVLELERAEQELTWPGSNGAVDGRSTTDTFETSDSDDVELLGGGTRPAWAIADKRSAAPNLFHE